MFKKITAFALFLFFISCKTDVNETNPTLDVNYEKFVLDNGLNVIFHIDKSDPVVAVSLTAHVGSAREKTGRTGFAHLFEHLLFLESENLGKGGLDQMSARIGGSGANGSTNRDRTNYYQTVPKNALEKMIWAEADKLGWFINTVTEPVLAKEKQVVKNEKRQRVDNQPYGHTYFVANKNLYPENHPYNWQVIGSLEDLQNATLADVKEFYAKWYTPDNVTLVIAGDFDTSQAKNWVKKYFDEIPSGDPIAPLSPQPAKLNSSIKVYHEDNFANLPELTLIWPGVEIYHPDSYALEVLCNYLSQGKSAPLYQVLVEEQSLTSNTSMDTYSAEIAGEVYLSITGFDQVDLDEVLAGIEQGLEKFEKEGISDEDLTRIKAQQEADFYKSISSVVAKSFYLAQYNIFANDPGFISKDLEQTLLVTKADVKRVYKKYIKDKPYVATSFVPKGQLSLALENSAQAQVVEETITQGSEETFDSSIEASYEKTPSSFDRSKEPPYGEDPKITPPKVWSAELSNGLKLLGIENNEVPVIDFNFVIKGGQVLETPQNLGAANLVAGLLTKGTANKTPQELEHQIELLGATLNISAQKESIRITGSALAKNFKETIALVEEILVSPRWDNKELALYKQEVISWIQQDAASPGRLADNQFDSLFYGREHILSNNLFGQAASIENMSMEQLKAYYELLSPSNTVMHVVGDVSESSAQEAVRSLAKNWPAKAVAIPETPELNIPNNSTVFFYDVPNAKQSHLRLGYPSLSSKDEDYFPAQVMNYLLGASGFASRLTQELREAKGYTYHADSEFQGGLDKGPFLIYCSVRSNVTLESLEVVKQILETYGESFSTEDLATTKSAMVKGNARAFETARAKLRMLENISTYNWSTDYVLQQGKVVENMTLEEIKSLANDYLKSDQMIWLVVGDAKTQMDRLEALGFGTPVLLNDDRESLITNK
ncbi:M16 family metallopeptidase [Reichenbachiella sp.]|uniref:M16 family metallopeptidase n=1 Tax=Reichenbachiella sp. TaxID=2184521 RepID=UPI003B59BBEE